jgi:hypothetical protein
MGVGGFLVDDNRERCQGIELLERVGGRLLCQILAQFVKRLPRSMAMKLAAGGGRNELRWNAGEFPIGDRKSHSHCQVPNL